MMLDPSRRGIMATSPLQPRSALSAADGMASEKSGHRAAAAWDSPLVKRRNNLIQREVRYLADEGENLPRVLFQCSDGEVLPSRNGRSTMVTLYKLGSGNQGVLPPADEVIE